MGEDARLDKKNITDIFLMMQNQPIELPSIEETKVINTLKDKTQGLLRQTDILDQIALFKAAKAKITAANKTAYTN